MRTHHSSSTPFPTFEAPTPEQCRQVHSILHALHGEEIEANFAQDAAQLQNEGQYDQPTDALVVAALSQATSWSNAKRAMASMQQVYGSTFAYDKIIEGGREKLASALRPGGMHNRKSGMLLKVLEQVKEKQGGWDLNYLPLELSRNYGPVWAR